PSSLLIPSPVLVRSLASTGSSKTPGSAARWDRPSGAHRRWPYCRYPATRRRAPPRCAGPKAITLTLSPTVTTATRPTPTPRARPRANTQRAPPPLRAAPPHRGAPRRWAEVRAWHGHLDTDRAVRGAAETTVAARWPATGRRGTGQRGQEA